jgi:hypothetical protein
MQRLGTNGSGLELHQIANFNIKEECNVLKCSAVWVLLESTFRRNVSPPTSGWKESAS